MTMHEYSRKLGKDSNFLYVYRSLRNMPKGTKACDVYASYVLERQYEDMLQKTLQDTYYEISEKTSLRQFFIYLHNHKIIPTIESGYHFFNHVFIEKERLVGKRANTRRETILKAWEQYRCGLK